MLLQPVSDPESDLGLKTMETIIIHIDSGEYCKVAHTFAPNPDNQKMGAQFTYLRRYSIVTLLGLQQDDTDGTDKDGNPVTDGTVKQQKPKQQYNKQQKPKQQKPKQQYNKQEDKVVNNPDTIFPWINTRFGLTQMDISAYMKKDVNKFPSHDRH